MTTAELRKHLDIVSAWRDRLSEALDQADLLVTVVSAAHDRALATDEYHARMRVVGDEQRRLRAVPQ